MVWFRLGHCYLVCDCVGCTPGSITNPYLQRPAIPTAHQTDVNKSKLRMVRQITSDDHLEYMTGRAFLSRRSRRCRLFHTGSRIISWEWFSLKKSHSLVHVFFANQSTCVWCLSVKALTHMGPLGSVGQTKSRVADGSPHLEHTAASSNSNLQRFKAISKAVCID